MMSTNIRLLLTIIILMKIKMTSERRRAMDNVLWAIKMNSKMKRKKYKAFNSKN